MTTLDELERSVERLNRAVKRLTDAAKRLGQNPDSAVVSKADLSLLLSERAELLADVERLQGALQTFTQEKPTSANGFVNISGRNVYVFAARAALTTGEAGSSIGQNDQPGLAFSAPERAG